MKGADRSDLIELRIPCAPEVLPMLLAGMPVRHIRLEDQGDGTHSLVVIGVQGPLSDPFENVRKEPCGALLIGRGTDTWDPTCVLPRGHTGRCEPDSDALDEERSS